MVPEGNIAWLDSLQRRGIKPGLENIEVLLGRIGDPRDGIRYIHVAGTDGKGSVCAMIESILIASGYRAGAFTSPHILRVNECIRMDGRDIPDGDLEDILGRLRPAVDAMSAEGLECTNFEVLTAAALLYFKECGAEIAVVEVGMGGRLDSTNVIVPEVAVINNIGMEHTAFLGTTLEQISLEKAGIMKPGVPCVTMNPDPVFDVLERRARECGCALERVLGEEAHVLTSRADGLTMEYRGTEYRVGLPGRHQARNATLAVEAVMMLRDRERLVAHIGDGLAEVRWPCRMQPVPDAHMILDVTHTLNGAKCLRWDVDEIYGRVVMVLAMLSDKDIDGVSGELAHVCDRVYIAAPDSPRAADPGTVAGIMGRYRQVDGVFPTVGEAIEAAMAARGDDEVLVTGSFRTAEDALRWLGRRSARFWT